MKRKSFCIFTSNRAEYGLLSPIIKKMRLQPDLDVRVVASGAHLSPEFGLTYQEIEQDGIAIDEKIEILLSADTPAAISKSMGLAMIGLSAYLARTKPDFFILLGDRYEAFAAAGAAMVHKIPIIHLYGGEITEGAIDDNIRHAITKLSYLHFTSTEEYRSRVIQLGEDPKRVFCVGAIGIENILHAPLLSKSELEESIRFKLDRPYALVTFHPVTLETQNSEKQVNELLAACDSCRNLRFIFTKANPDTDGRIINQLIDDYVEKHDHAVAYVSLGMSRYLSTLKYAAMIIGNSSSGIIEAPSFKIPTINIGDRQKGRIQAESVINCQPNRQDIQKAIVQALDKDFSQKTKKVKNPYGDGNTSGKIIKILYEFALAENCIDLKKQFYGIDISEK